MQFTSEEQKMIAWLRRQHACWKSTRMIILVSSIFCTCFALYELSHSDWGAMPLILLLVSVYGLSYTLGSWSGRPEISLLLKLVEYHERNDRT